MKTKTQKKLEKTEKVNIKRRVSAAK